MKITTFFILIAAGSVFAKNTYSQNTRLSIHLENATLHQVFDEIQKKSEFIIFYKDNQVDVNHSSTIDFNDATVDLILDEAFKSTDLGYKIIDRQIVILTDKLKDSPSALVTATNAEQQKKEISGTVKDSKGTMPGVSVAVKGTTTGSITDIDGKFSLEVPTGAKTLVFSFVGMKAQEVAIGDKLSFSVILEEETIGLNEIVTVGYGVMRKSDFAGSSSKIKIDGAEERPVSTMEGLIQGRAAGVQVTANSGTPGGEMTFRVRGSTSTSSDNQPLIIIDGYPIETSNNILNAGIEGTINDQRGASGLAGISPSDIESVEILKDASATAIYGSRGANGVVMITTKRGKLGKEKIEYNVRLDFANKLKDLGLLSTTSFENMWNEAYRNSNPTSANPYFTSADYARNPDTRWQDMVLQNSFGQTHSLNISGGDPKMKYSINGSYADLDGPVKYASNFKRGTLRINLDREVSSIFNFGIGISGTSIANQAVGQSNANGNLNGNIINSIMTAPLANPYDQYGDLTMMRFNNGGGNPLTLIKNIKDLTKTYQFNINSHASLTILKGLTANLRVGMDYKRNQRNQYQPRDTRIGQGTNGFAYSAEGDDRNYLSDFTFNYNNNFGKHRINSMVGFSHQEWQSRSYANVTTGFASDMLGYYVPQASNKVQTPFGTFRENGMNSFISRLGYSYDDRYLMTLTGRSDGSTRLAEGHKWAYFPSVGIGWNMHNELFLKNQKILSQLKIRGSWGISGNQSVPIGASRTTYSYAKYSYNQNVSTGYILNAMGNPDLGWETTSQYNIGLESGFLNDRFTFNVDVYKKRTNDLLFNKQIPAYTGYSFLQTNGGIIENKGLEFEIGAKVLKKKLIWNVSANLSMNRNKVLDLGGAQIMYGPAFNGNMGKNQAWTIAKIGEPIGIFYGYKIDGIYQTAAEVAAGPTDPTKFQGNWRFVDVSGPAGVKDNKITPDDMTKTGDPNPNFTYGITNNLSYKGFSLSAFIMGSQGNDILNMYRIQTDALTVNSNPPNTTNEVYNQRWTGPGTSTKYPMPLFVNNRFGQRPNNTLVENGSYIKLKTVTIAYDVLLQKKKYFEKLRIFITGNNLFCITKYSGFDPEINSYGFNSMSQGLDLGSMPQVRSFSSGILIGF